MTAALMLGVTARHRTTGTPVSSGGGPGLVGTFEAESLNLVGNGNTTVTSTSFVPAVGELLVVKATSGNASAMPNTISGGGVTWTKRVNVGTPGQSSPVVIWTAAVGTASAMTVSVVFANTGIGAEHGAFVVERYSGATVASTPVIATVNPDTVSPYQSTLTTTAANSVVSWMAADILGVNGTVTYVGGPTQTYRYQEATAGRLSFSTAYQLAAAAGAQTFGLSAPAGQTVTLGAIELIAGTPTTTPTPPPSTTIALDSTTPAVVRRAYGTGTTATSASFTPPTGAVLVALVNVGWGAAPASQPSLSVTDSVGGTWTQLGTVFGGGVQSAIFTSPVTAATARTVAATTSSTTGKSMQLAVRVFTGAASPVLGSNTWTSTTSMTTAVTTTTTGSTVLVAGSRGANTAGGITATAATTSIDAWSDTLAGDDMAVGASSLETSTPGAVNIGWTPAGRSVALELLPGATSDGGGSGAALISSLSDNFDTGSLSSLWTPNGAGVIGNQLYVNVAGNAGTPTYSNVRSAQGYQWSGSTLTFKVPTMPGVAGSSNANAQFWVMDPAPAATVDRLGFEYVCAANRLDCIGQTGAAYVAVGATESLTYSATTHLWMRLAHTGASIVWSTSPDGATWTVRRTLTSPPAWTTKTNLIVSFEGFRTSGTNDTVRIDDVNAADTDPPPPEPTVGYGGSGYGTSGYGQ